MRASDRRKQPHPPSEADRALISKRRMTACAHVDAAAADTADYTLNDPDGNPATCEEIANVSERKRGAREEVELYEREAAEGRA